MTEFKPIFRSQKFLYLWGSQILSQVTINMMNFILLARLYTVTGSSIATSLLWVAYCLPTLFFGPIGAATVDLLSRRKILFITNLLQAVIIFSYIFINQQSIFILYAVVLLYSLLNQFYVPAEAAYLPSTVSKENLVQANSIFFMTIQASLILGFGLAGVLQRFISFNGVLILCSVFLFLAFLSTFFLPEIKNHRAIPEEFEKALKTFFGSIIEGYDFIKRNKLVLYPLLLLLGIQAGLAIITVSLPVIAVQVLGISVTFAGVLVVIPAGIGAVLGSIYIPRLMKNGMRKIRIIEPSLGVIIFSMMFLSLVIPFLPVIDRLIISPFLVAAAGFGFVGAYLPTLTFLQAYTPIWLRGRVFGNLSFLYTLVTIFPVLFSGAITELFGIRAVLTLLALGTLAVLILSVRRGHAIVKESY